MIEDQNATLIVYNQLDGKQVHFPKQIEHFSVILSIQLGNESTRITVPSSVQIPTSCIQQIKCFLQLHSYNPKQIKTKPISSISLPYSKICTPSTSKYISQYLQNKNDEQIRQLWTAANYFKIQMVTRVICLYLLEKYGLPFQERKVKQIMQQYGLEENQQYNEKEVSETVRRNQDYDREQEKKQVKRRKLQKLKQRYLSYFKSYGTKLMMEMDEQPKSNPKQT